MVKAIVHVKSDGMTPPREIHVEGSTGATWDDGMLSLLAPGDQALAVFNLASVIGVVWEKNEPSGGSAEEAS